MAYLGPKIYNMIILLKILQRLKNFKKNVNNTFLLNSKNLNIYFGDFC